MAKYFLLIRPLSRGKGARATRSAAYRAGEIIRDERTGQTHNFSGRGDVVYKEIVLPSQLADSADMGWARDRSTLWNAAEHAGHQRNSRVAREVLVILPPELTPTQRTNLVRTFSRDLADKYRNAVDVAIHPPRAGADERHHHAHLLMTTREVTADGLGPRTTIELGGEERQARGLGPTRNEYFWVRERWAQVTNEALREAGLTARIDHRSLKNQGVDREPVAKIPQKVYYAERKSGRSTQVGDDIRARHRERVEARLKGGDELARILQR
jgi:ATP-dependent exoDNAse (exonuclease V) alpha subunit